MPFPKFTNFAIYMLVIVSMWSPGPGSPLGSLGEPLRYGLFAAACLAVVVRAYATTGITVSLSADWTLLIAFLLYTCLSVLWSDGGANAAIKAALVLFTLAASICIVNLKGLDEILVIFYNVAAGFVFLSLLVVVLFPGTGIETGWELAGDWKGLAGQKNELGAIAALVLVAAVMLPPRGGMAGIFTRLSVLAVSSVCLINSGSRGGQLIAAVGIAALVGSRLPRTLQRLILVMLLVFCVPLIQLVLSTIQLDADQIGVLGTTINTSSRTTIWFYGLDQLQSHLFLGFGLGGFWTPGRLTAFKDIHGWVLDNFHNGYITILVEGGIIGLVALLAATVSILLLLLVSIGHLRDPYLSVAFAYTVMFFVSNLVENQVGRSTSPIFFLFLVVSFAIHGRAALLAGFRPANGGGRDPQPGHAGRRHGQPPVAYAPGEGAAHFGFPGLPERRESPFREPFS